MSEPSGIIKLIHRAPLDMTYQHQIDFKTPSEQQTYWESKVKYRLLDYTYIRRERRSIKVNKSFDELEGINYLIYQAHSADGTKLYYCFVTDRAYINDTTTAIYFEVDVFQTFMFDYTFKPTYISQAHVDRWDANHFPKYSKTEEGLAYGSEYVTESAYKIKPNTKTKHGFYLVYCVSHTVEEGASPEATVNVTAPIPYCIYVLPNIEDATALNVNTALTKRVTVTYTDSDGASYTNQVSTLATFQAKMANSAIGQYVKQIVYVPYLPFKYTVGADNSGILHVTLLEGVWGVSKVEGIPLLKIRGVDNSKLSRVLAETDIFTGLESAIPTDEMWAALKANPRTTERDRRYESKLLCYPYRYNLLTDWVSTPAVIKNEYIAGDKITIKERLSFGFNFPRRYYIDNYRKDLEGREASITQVIPHEQAIISDAYYSYMLENKNQISANLANAQYSLNASVGVGLMNTAVSAASGFVSGGGAGAAMNAISGLTSVAGTAITGATNINNMMRSENAKQQDIRAVPDTIVNSNDCGMVITDDTKYITWYRKVICCEFQEMLAQYWHMFGYKVNRMETPNLRSRVRYNYIKTIGANIEGAMESGYLAALKAIFDNGLTIWHYSAADFKPLDYTYENPEVLLI